MTIPVLMRNVGMMLLQFGYADDNHDGADDDRHGDTGDDDDDHLILVSVNYRGGITYTISWGGPYCNSSIMGPETLF